MQKGYTKDYMEEAIEKDMKALRLQRMDVHDRNYLRTGLINEGQANPR
jgi:hypothetical protein